MRSEVGLLGLALAVLPACSTVSRRAVVNPATAATLPPGTRVIAVNDAPVGSGSVVPDGDGFDLVADGRRVRLGTTDRLAVTTVYRDGDVIRGEGQVHVRGTPSMILGGVFALVGGAASLGMTVWVVSALGGSYDSFGGISGIAFGAASIAAGLALLVVGATPRAHVEPWLAPAVFMVPRGGGGGITLRF